MTMRFGMIALLILAVNCSIVSLAAADVSSRWFAPIMLKTTPSADSAGNSYGTMEVVLQVTPSVKPGPFEYVYWITNSAATPMSDFYLTCVGVGDLSSFLSDGYEVLNGTRQGTDGVVTFVRGPAVTGWGNTTTGQDTVPYMGLANYYPPGSDTLVESTKIRWSALCGNPGLPPAGSIGFSFTSIYLPSAVAKDLTGSLAIRMFNGEVYAYGPEPVPHTPEWSSIMLATSAFGFIGAIRRRRRS